MRIEIRFKKDGSAVAGPGGNLQASAKLGRLGLGCDSWIV